MKSVKLGVRWISMAAFVLSWQVRPCSGQAGQADQTLAASMDGYMSTATRSGLFTGAVLVARDGKILISKGYGMANLQYDVPNSPQTRFDIGSVSKTFTATLILM